MERSSLLPPPPSRSTRFHSWYGEGFFILSPQLDTTVHASAPVFISGPARLYLLANTTNTSKSMALSAAITKKNLST
ncbi:hypothetical protein EJB05_08351 [Eragrostis curvula]|uniref:Uncharacterized protein n=1 Tax=Eragrostis curvula TaxID=38414 RepID=A0A5J9WLA4_9POAL|nr:hypothetical protein EJB05_08351 [Eragrostis curvula]